MTREKLMTDEAKEEKSATGQVQTLMLGHDAIYQDEVWKIVGYGPDKWQFSPWYILKRGPIRTMVKANEVIQVRD